jgi:hypothetical protein
MNHASDSERHVQCIQQLVRKVPSDKSIERGHQEADIAGALRGVPAIAVRRVKCWAP